MAAFAEWLIGWGKQFAVMLANFVIDMVQSIIDGVPVLITAVAALLPSGSAAPLGPSNPGGAVASSLLNCLPCWVLRPVCLLRCGGNSGLCCNSSACTLGQTSKIGGRHVHDLSTSSRNHQRGWVPARCRRSPSPRPP